MSNVQLVKSDSSFAIQPNLFTNSSVALSRLEQKIMSQIFNRIQVDVENPSIFSLPVAKISRNTNSVRKALDKLRTRSFRIPDDTGKKKDWSIPLIGEKYYHTGKGTIDVELNAKFMEIMRLVKSSDGFTKYVLSQAMTFRSKYTQPLYEFLSKWHDKKSITIDVVQLQFIMGCKGMVYSQFHDRCWKPAVKELNEKTDFKITYSTERTGRTVTKHNIQLSDKRKLQREQVRQETNAIEQQVEQMSAGEQARVAASLMKDYNFAAWQQDKIMSTPSMFKKFAVVDHLIINGDIKGVRDKTRYMAVTLFAPRRRKTG